MIASWADEAAKLLFDTGRSKRIPADLRRSAAKKLLILDAASALSDLASPPGNRLHALGKDRAGRHAIRINDQFRICFIWRDGNAHDVEITDYH